MVKIHQDIGAYVSAFKRVLETFDEFLNYYENIATEHNYKKWNMNSPGFASVTWAIIDAVIPHPCIIVMYNEKTESKEYKIKWVKKMWDTIAG